MRDPHRSITLSAAALAAVLVLSACGGSEEAASPSSAPSERPVAESSPPAASEPSAAESPSAADEIALSDAEVQFLQGMIPHHQSAIEMAQLVPESTQRPELLELSDLIIESQEAEIEQMRSLLIEAGEDPDAMGDMGMGMGGEGMSEMMDPSMMTAQLEGLQGQEFDLAFLDLMIMHHQGAIEMSEMVLEQGADGEIADLAESIIEEQRAEIEQMQEWQQAWA